MPYLGEEIQKLGFGLMRLPKIGNGIDVEQVKKMADRFLDAGFTYFDTAWINCKTREEAIGQFGTSLEQTGAGYFDFYLLHNLGESRTRLIE